MRGVIWIMQEEEDLDTEDKGTTSRIIRIQCAIRHEKPPLKDPQVNPSKPPLWRQTDASISRVLLEDTAIDDALVDARGLVTILGDVANTVDGLLEQSKVELALAAEIVVDGIRDGLEGVIGAGEEDLDGAGITVSRSSPMKALSGLLLHKIQLQRKVVKHAILKRRIKQQLPVIHIPKQLQRVRVGRVLAQDGPCLEHKLVGAEVGALQKGELVLVREVERAHAVLEHAKVQRLDALRAGVSAVVAGGDQLGAAEGGLRVEDRVVGDEGLNGFRFEVDVKLGGVSVWSKGWCSWEKAYQRPGGDGQDAQCLAEDETWFVSILALEVPETSSTHPVQ